MFKDTKAFSGFSVDDIPVAKAFYGETLGLDVGEENGMLRLNIAGGNPVLVYPKDNHVPAEYTVLNFPVDGHRGDGSRADRAGRHLRAVQRPAGRARHLPWRGPADRLVQGPGRQHPVAHSGLRDPVVVLP